MPHSHQQRLSLFQVIPGTRFPQRFVCIVAPVFQDVKGSRRLTATWVACYNMPMFSSVFKGFGRLASCLSALVLSMFLLVSASAEQTGILVTFMGDCTLGSEEWLKGQPTSFDAHVNENGLAYPFAMLQDVFAKDDLTIINLENVFYDQKTPRAEKNYTFRGPTAFAGILKQGSVEAAFVANNHILDYGRPGMNSTTQSLENLGIGWFGSNYAANKTFVFEKNGIKIGFFGSYYSYWGSHFDVMRKAVQQLKDAGCQVIVGIVHDGVEYATNRHFRQEDMAKWMINNGAQLVIGHHPHVPQGIDIIGDAYVVYSLGNGSFGGNISLDITRRPGVRADKALLAQVEFRFDEHRHYLGQQLNLIPISPSGTKEHNNYQPVLLSGQEAQATIQLVQDDTSFELAPFVEGIGALQPFLPVGQPE